MAQDPLQKRKEVIDDGGPRHLDPYDPNYGLPFKITEKAVLNISVDGKHFQVVIGLFGETVPRTVENFKKLCTGELGFGYKGTKFHRLVRGFVLQGGDIEKKNGFGGYSIYNSKGTFEDENYLIRHREGSVAMANGKKHKNGSQFYILMRQDAEWLNNRHVVFGQILEGYRHSIRRIGNVAVDAADRPVADITLDTCEVRPFENPLATKASTEMAPQVEDAPDDPFEEGPENPSKIRRKASEIEAAKRLREGRTPKEGHRSHRAQPPHDDIPRPPMPTKDRHRAPSDKTQHPEEQHGPKPHRHARAEQMRKEREERKASHARRQEDRKKRREPAKAQ